MPRRISLWLLRLSVLLGTRLAAACPLCADNLANDAYGKNPTALGRGFFWSIIFMIALPFVTVGVVAARIMIAKRRQRSRSVPEPAPDFASQPSS